VPQALPSLRSGGRWHVGKPTLIIHALQDTVAPIEGGANSMSIAELAEMWRSHNRCDANARLPRLWIRSA